MLGAFRQVKMYDSLTHIMVYWKYLPCAASFTLVHKIPVLWNARVECYDSETGFHGNRQVMFVEKVLIMAAATLYSPVSAPVILFHDLNHLDSISRGHQDSVNYNCENNRDTLLHYIFF